MLAMVVDDALDTHGWLMGGWRATEEETGGVRTAQ